jgi:hypothetical protein
MSDLDSLQKEVLVGIGRNVLNLQKMEGMLKSLVLMVSYKAPLELDNAEAAVRKRRKMVSKLPMGRLVEDLTRFVRPNRDDSESQSPTVATIEFSFRFEDADYVKGLRSTLRKVVKERNDLIHKKLIAFDPKSPESCRILAKELEEQRQRIRPKFEELAAIWTAVSEQIKEVKEYYDSGQFEDDWKVAQEGLTFLPALAR